MNTPRDSRSPAALRERLRAADVETSDAHDAAVLGAARETGHVRASRLTSEHPRPVRSWHLPAALGAAALFGLAGLYLTNVDGGDDEPAQVLPADAAGVVPASGARLVGAPAMFSWPRDAGAAGYILRIYDTEARVVWVSDTLSAPRAGLPRTVRKTLARAGTYLWTVHVILPERSYELGPYSVEVTY